MKVYVKQFTQEAGITILEKGDWFDLAVSEDTVCKAGKVTYVPLGVAMKLPKGCEAIVAARSSTPKKQHIIEANGIGIIDNSYCGNGDEWKFPAMTIGNDDVLLKAGTRIAQFRIQLSQKADFLDRLAWLFNGKIEFSFVSSLAGVNRKGFGSTGVTKEDAK